MSPVPEVSAEPNVGHSTTALAVRANGSRLLRRAFDVDQPFQIVVVISAECHFAQNGLADILSDLPTDIGFQDIANWNRAHPEAPMMIAYSPQEWPIISTWGNPTFYFLSRSKVIAEVVGWPKTGRKALLRAAIRRLTATPK